MTTPRNIDPSKPLANQPRQDILAIANAVFAIVKSQVAAGQKLSPEEKAIYDRASERLPVLNRS